ncbi:hypothetical protein HD598_000966 [Neomicrococcus aestuarii]|uniref:FAD-dependent oxidoreductase 2 FAD-binding domain-containing protein n=1 Tax=Neomicrococcus aestuarii TaxID=556325 RepID=A0A7W8TSZ7_9MICC|nr:FAD-binding dehydrogenase [Neomicrococcus aestuarii]MBB5512279.1 hypothetical protein [Neomicrococcus aestuarii]
MTATEHHANLSSHPSSADVIVVGVGLAGLVAACEAVEAGRSVLILDQEGPNNLGGQAWWSFGGLFLVDSPEQRRFGVKDSLELAKQDWGLTAGFDRPEDYWPRLWAEKYVEWAGGEKRAWLRDRGVSLFPVVGWAERGETGGIGNSVPRFHITWGTGPGLLKPFIERVLRAASTGQVRFGWRHRLQNIDYDDATSAVTGVSGDILAPDSAERGEVSSRDVVGSFRLTAPRVVIATGGIGGNPDKVRAAWPERLGSAPEHFLTGVPAYVDGSGIEAVENAGGRVINRDRMWHYTEGIENWDPVWPKHGIRILPGPSSLWLDAQGNRLPDRLWPGFDTLGTLTRLRGTGHDYSWFILNKDIIGKEFALSGSEQNPDLTDKSIRDVLRRARAEMPDPVRVFVYRGADFVMADSVRELADEMNQLTGEGLIDAEQLVQTVAARDAGVGETGTDAQIDAVRAARSYAGDKLIRTVPPGRLVAPEAGPLIAVRLHILTRKTLGGLETDLDGRVLRHDGTPITGLFAAGEASGFGGGGLHGYRSLEGTFLGGCLFSGMIAGRSAASL